MLPKPGLEPKRLFDVRNDAAGSHYFGMIRLLIVDDRSTIRRGVRMCLAMEPDIIIVGEAGDGNTALALAQATRPDVVLTEIVMADMDGTAAVGALRTVAPETAVIVHTIRDDAATRARALAAGAVAVIAKRKCGEDLGPAIREAAARRGVHTSEVAGVNALNRKEMHR